MSADGEVSVVKLPLISLTDEQMHALWVIPDEEKLKLLQRVFSDCGYSLDDVPETWTKTPLTRWTWLVLEVNEIPYDENTQQPLGDFGVDTSILTEETQRWVWFLM